MINLFPREQDARPEGEMTQKNVIQVFINKMHWFSFHVEDACLELSSNEYNSLQFHQKFPMLLNL